MNRREMLHASLLPLFMVGGVFASNGQRQGKSGEDCFFYDERFSLAETLISEFAVAGALIPVRSDITKIWNEKIKTLSRQDPLLLKGITTESFHFCLFRMLQGRGGIETSLERIDQDLYAWTISICTAKPKGIS